MSERDESLSEARAGRTVRVRIAGEIDAEGRWSFEAWSMNGEYIDCVDEATCVPIVVVADLPIPEPPEPQEVAGEVEVVDGGV